MRTVIEVKGFELVQIQDPKKIKIYVVLCCVQCMLTCACSVCFQRIHMHCKYIQRYTYSKRTNDPSNWRPNDLRVE